MSEKIGKIFGEFLEKEIFNEEKVQAFCEELKQMSQISHEKSETGH